MQVFHGTIIACDAENTVAEYLVEREGRIAYIGNELPLKYRKIPPIEVGAGAIVPSFVDAYSHYSFFSILKQLFPISDIDSNSKILDQLSEYAKDSKDSVIVGFGASEFAVEEGHLIVKEQLDSIKTDKPICVIKYDAHSCVVNSAMIEIIRGRAATLRGYNEVTGEMKQEAFDVVTEVVTRGLSTRRVIEAMLETSDYIAARGIGLMCSASGLGFVKDYNFEMERAVSRGLDNGLKMQVTYQTNSCDGFEKKELYRVSFMNLDGTLSNADASLYEDYELYSHKGIAYFSDEEIIDFCKAVNRAGKQITLHACGDAAFDQAVNAIVEALEDYPRYEHRHMILHANLATEKGLELCKKYNIMLCVQPSAISFPVNVDKYMKKLLGEKRFERVNPVKSYLNAGVEVCFNSDAPASDPNPIRWINDVVNNPNVDEAVSVYDALRMATYYGAKACFEERECGSLEIGKSCDLVLLDKNPYAVEASELSSISVKKLYLRGKVYEHTRSGAIATLLRGMFPQ